MRRERKVAFLLFAVCLVVVALPVSGRELAQRQIVWNRACGDGLLDPREECDPGNPEMGIEPDLGGKTCESEGYTEGDLACTPTCRVDRSGCSCGPLAAVAKTGQTACWDFWGSPIYCAGTGQDGELQMGVSVSPRFTDNGDGTVTDNLTGLIWLKQASRFGFGSWQGAWSAVGSLKSGRYGLTDGSVAGDWRMPNVREMQSLIDYSRFFPALPADHPFSGVLSYWYWTSTTFEKIPDNAWTVELGHGYVGVAFKGNTNYVWPVRGGR